MSEFENEDVLFGKSEIIRLPAHSSEIANGHDKARERRQPPPKLVSASSFAGRPLPDRKWLVHGLVPLGSVTMLAGDGGLGKSLLAMQLATACATGTPWLGRQALECTTAAFHCEDEVDELHLRQHAINKAAGLQFEDLTRLNFMSRVGEDNLLIKIDKFGKTTKEPTDFFKQIRAESKSVGAQLIILDSLHDLFGGNENIRSDARGFIDLLRRLALELNAAVVLLSHPSASGLSSGSGTAGSTAWNNAVRSRLYLTRPISQEDPDVRELKGMKANYGALERTIKLRWEGGIFIVEGGGGSHSGPIAMAEIESAIAKALSILVRQGTFVSASDVANNGLSPCLRKAGMCIGYSAQEINSAKARMVVSGKLKEVRLGTPSRLRIGIRPADALYPEEQQELKL